jgi:hypothetical protein
MPSRALRRPAWTAVGTLFAALLVVLWVPSGAGEAAISCGGFRWPVKTLSDPGAMSVDYTPTPTTVDRLRSLPPPRGLRASTPRLQPTEYRTFRIRATLVRAKIAGDHDIHAVVAQPRRPRHTMIVEFPYVYCNGAAKSPKRAAMHAARRRFIAACGSIRDNFVTLRGTATISGVGFWDKIAGQSGRAPNGIELHPVLGFHGACQQT